MSDNVAPGYRFSPTEEELVSFYLRHKLQGSRQDMDRAIPVLDIYSYNPWDLPQFAGELCRGDTEQWFFFINRPEREARGGRPNRQTTEGYWKATGQPTRVYSTSNTTATNRVIGEKRTMVFYRGRAHNGRKTHWKMNEYRALDHNIKELRQEISLCRVYIRSRSQRSFDRRPPAPPQNTSTSSTTTTCEAAISGEAFHPIPDLAGSSSPGGGSPSLSSSSSSAVEEKPCNNPEAVETAGNWNLVDDTEPLWDWDSFGAFN